MAILDLNVGTAANSNDGATLRNAFINVRKMMYEIYGVSTDPTDVLDSYTDQLDLATGSQTFKESVQDIVGAMFTGNTETNITATYEDSDGTIDLVVSADLDSIGAGDGLTGTSLTSGDPVLNVVGGDGITSSADEIEVTVDDSTIELSATNGSGAVRIKDLGVTTAKIADDNITHAKLEGRYTAKASSSATGNQNLDCSTATTFLLNGNIATATLTLQNLKLGQVVDIVMSGTLSSADITLATDFTSATIRKVGSASLDTSTTNVIQVVCIDDTDSAALVHYSINTFATQPKP